MIKEREEQRASRVDRTMTSYAALRPRSGRGADALWHRVILSVERRG